MATSPASSSTDDNDVEAVSLFNSDIKERRNPFDRLVAKSRIVTMTLNKGQKYALLVALVVTAVIIGMYTNYFCYFVVHLLVCLFVCLYFLFRTIHSGG